MVGRLRARKVDILCLDRQIRGNTTIYVISMLLLRKWGKQIAFVRRVYIYYLVVVVVRHHSIITW